MRPRFVIGRPLFRGSPCTGRKATRTRGTTPTWSRNWPAGFWGVLDKKGQELMSRRTAMGRWVKMYLDDPLTSRCRRPRSCEITFFLGMWYIGHGAPLAW